MISDKISASYPAGVSLEFIDENGGGPGVRLRNGFINSATVGGLVALDWANPDQPGAWSGTSPQFGSCLENSVIRPKVSGQTLRFSFMRL